MGGATASGGRVLPSERTIAFAISVVASKPPELSVAEYIQLLRQHIAKGRRENALSSTYRHLDRSSYWRSECERTKRDLQSAERDSVDLKREIDTLKEKLSSLKPSPTKKRKRPDEDVVPVPKSPKLPRQEAASGKKVPDISLTDIGFDFSGVGEVGNILMRSIYQIHAQLRSHDKTEPQLLAYQIVRAAAALAQVVAKTIEHQKIPGQTDSYALKSVLVAASRSCRSLNTGFNRICHVAGGAEVRGQVIYAFVQAYRKLIECLGDISESESAGSGQPDVLSKGRSKQRVPTAKDNVTLDLMTRLLCTMIDELDSTAEAHRALFEGFAFVILEKLGPQLYLMTFGQPRGPTIEAEIMASKSSEEAESGRAPTSRTADEQKLNAAKLEAPYLIHLLNRLMATASAHLGTVMANKTGKAKQANSKGSTKSVLAVAAKERLQRTLVNCMFGTEGLEESDPFMDCLRMPVLTSQPLPMPKLKEVDVGDWFMEEVWRLLGWEILGGEGDW